MRRSLPLPTMGRSNSSKLRSIASRELSTAKNSTSEPSFGDDGLVTNRDDWLAVLRVAGAGGAGGTPSRDELDPAHRQAVENAARHRAGVAGIDDHPDIGAARPDLVERHADLVVDDAVLDGFGGAVVAAGIDRQHHLIEIAALRVLVGAAHRLLGAVAGEVDQHEIAGLGALAERREGIEDVGPGRLAGARRKLRPGGQPVGQHRHVGKAALAQCPPHQRDVVGGPLQRGDVLEGVVRHPDQERVIGRIGNGGQRQHRQQRRTGGSRDPQGQSVARACNRKTVVGHATLLPPQRRPPHRTAMLVQSGHIKDNLPGARLRAAIRIVLAGAGILATAATAQAETRALLVGVAAYQHLAEGQHLSAPRNDVVEMRELLIKRGIKRQNITILTDPGKPPERLSNSERERLPTRRNILAALDTLTKSSQRGDLAVVYMSGHGSFQPDQPDGPDRDEEDGFDEVFLPYDVDVSSPDGRATVITNGIIDDELGKFSAAIRDKGVDLWFTLDSCHSGTGMRASGEARAKFIDPAALGVNVERDLSRPATIGFGDKSARRRHVSQRAGIALRRLPPRQGRIPVRRAGQREGRRIAAAAVGAARQGDMALRLYPRDGDGAQPSAEPDLSRSRGRSERNHARHGGPPDHADGRT